MNNCDMTEFDAVIGILCICLYILHPPILYGFFLGIGKLGTWLIEKSEQSNETKGEATK